MYLLQPLSMFQPIENFLFYAMDLLNTKKKNTSTVVFWYCNISFLSKLRNSYYHDNAFLKPFLLLLDTFIHYIFDK